MEEMMWRDFAICSGPGFHPMQFFPAPEKAAAAERYELEKPATRLCNGCPVVEPCLEWALIHQKEGVAGGKTSDERRRILRIRSQRAATG